jgi:hypothetical protein
MFFIWLGIFIGVVGIIVSMVFGLQKRATRIQKQKGAPGSTNLQAGNDICISADSKEP